MRVSQVIAELSKLDPNAELVTWWMTKDYAETYLTIDEQLDPVEWELAVEQFENSDTESIQEQVAELINYCLRDARESLAAPIPYTLTDKGARSV